MFSNIGKYEPCKIFTKGHFILIIITLITIIIALKYTQNKSKDKIKKIIQYLTVLVCFLEIIKIVFSISQNSFYAVNTYVPLYYCSMLIYAGLMSSFGKGKLKKTGEVFLSTGGIIGGIVFIILPTTSLPSYPAFHFISIYSFLYHGIMVYLGLLLNKTMYIKLEKSDIKYFASLVGSLCLIALIVNSIFDSNLMFVSKNFPNTPIEIIYNLTNGSVWFNIIMIVSQMTLPFYIVYYFNKKFYVLENEVIKNDEEKLSIC